MSHLNVSDGNSSDIVASKQSQRKMKKRPAVIADITDDQLKDKTVAKNVIPEGNKDHLETKKQIETLRKQYGDGWLHRQGATMVHDVLGMEREKIEKSVSSEEMLKTLLAETSAAIPNNVDCVTSTPNKLSQNASTNNLSCNEVSKSTFYYRKVEFS